MSSELDHSTEQDRPSVAQHGEEQAEPALTVAILAGGQSQRFGVDKAVATCAGQTLLQIAIDNALAVSERIIVVGRELDKASQQHVHLRVRQASNSRGCNLQCLPDEQPGIGPLGGLATALRAAKGPVLLLSCDMPALTRGIMHWLTADWRSGPVDSGVLPFAGQYAQLCAAIYPQRMLPLCDQALDRGQRSLHSVALPGQSQVIRTSLSASQPQAALMRRVAVPADMIWRFTNCNTPQQLATLEQRILRGGRVRA